MAEGASLHSSDQPEDRPAAAARRAPVPGPRGCGAALQKLLAERRILIVVGPAALARPLLRRRWRCWHMQQGKKVLVLTIDPRGGWPMPGAQGAWA